MRGCLRGGTPLAGTGGSSPLSAPASPEPTVRIEASRPRNVLRAAQRRNGGLVEGASWAKGSRRAAAGASKGVRRAGAGAVQWAWGTLLPWPPCLEQSNGPGLGATFTLEMPYLPVQASA